MKHKRLKPFTPPGLGLSVELPPSGVKHPPSHNELRAWARTVDFDWLFGQLRAAGVKWGRVKLQAFLEGKRPANHHLHEALKKLAVDNRWREPS
jgi:hypothetical protein